MKKLYINIFTISVFNIFLTVAYTQNPLIQTPSDEAVDAEFFKYIPSVDYTGILAQTGTTSFTTTYTPSSSYWLDPTPADEEHVFLAQMKHVASTSENSWELGIGKGGQIYSFKSAYGEGIPPQSKEHSTWNDEVWQPVAVNGDLNNRDYTPQFYFIHGAGAYNNDGITQTFYSPLMASYYDASEKAYYVCNWGTQAHVPSLYKSGLLYTTKYKEIGEGILEVTYIIQNFGDDTVGHLNVPWGGVRSSSLRNQFIGNPDGSIVSVNANTASNIGTDPLAIDIDESGGYVLWSSDSVDNEAASLGIVFGNELKSSELASHDIRNIFYRLAQVGGDTNPRDYTLFTVIAQIDVNPGDIFYYRTYYINGTRDFVQEKANLLAPYSDYGFIEPSILDTETVTINSTDLEGALSQDINLYTTPIEDMVPIFLMENTVTEEQYISPDLYANIVTEAYINPYDPEAPEYETYQNREINKPYVSDVKFLRLLGYAYQKDMSHNSAFTLLDDLILDTEKIVLTSEFSNNIWVKTGESICDGAIVPRSEIYGSPPTSDTLIEINEGDSIILKPQVNINGTTSVGDSSVWTWSGPNGFTQTGRNVIFDPITASNFGNYTVNYQLDNCLYNQEFELNEISLSVESDDLDLSHMITIFPNPFSETILIDNNLDTISKIEVYNMLGQTVAYKNGTKKQTTLNLSHLTSGLYFVEIIIDKFKVTKKILKQ